jgi:hypothetical protein
MKKKYIGFFCLLTLALAGCQKGIHQPQVDAKKELDPKLVYVKPTTAEEKDLVDNLSKITEVLKTLYKNNSNLKIVNAAIYAKAYTDESILLKDLIYPANGLLTANKKFQTFCKKWNLNLEEFSQNFWNEEKKLNDQEFDNFLSRMSNSTSRIAAPAEVSIYFPYSEEFSNQLSFSTYSPITSLVTATADADEGWGNQPHYINGVLQNYTQVLVNDDYAESHPTQIIGVNGIEPNNEPALPMTAFPPGNPIDVPNLTREVKQVYIGDVRCNGHQYDAFISFTGNGGGSEIRFTRADGFLKIVDGQVQADMFVVGDGKSISRHEIKHHILVDYSREWDGDWEENNFQQNLAIYEEDNRNTSTISGSVNTTATITATPVVITAGHSIGFTLNYKSDDAIIKQTNYNRDVFFILNRTNLEGEMYNGWPIRDRTALVSFTLNDRTFY